VKTLNKIDAKEIGMAVSYDPQFRMPIRPKVSKYVNLVSCGDDGVIFDGSPEKQLFRGSAVKKFLYDLISLADGTRTVQEIAETLDTYPSQFIYNALALLYSRGLLQEGTSSHYLEETPYYKFIERHIDVTRVNLHPTEAIERLHAYSVFIHGKPDDVQYLSNELRQYDISIVDHITPFTEDSKLFAIAICDDINDLMEIKPFASQCYEYSIPWILITFSHKKIYVGPYFERNETLCFECYLKQMNRIDEISIGTNTEMTDPLLKKIGLDYSGIEVVHLLSRIASSHLIHNLKKVDIETFEYTPINVSRLPFCEWCDPIKGMEPTINLVSQYESYIAFPSSHLINPKDHQNHYKPGNLELAKSSIVYPSCPHINLPHQDSLPDLNSNPRNFSDLQLLTKLMLLTAGLKKNVKNNNPRVYRWAPTGGNLGSVGVYFVNKGVKELQTGVYFYQTSTHTLAQLNDSFEEEVLEKITIDSRLSKGTLLGYLIFSGSYDRVYKKYKEFAYKIIHLDAGVAYAQSQVVAQLLGLELQLCESWNNDEIEHLLRLDHLNEPVTLVATLHRRGESND
jgi:SagB-type dehydrogenase family enzyme